MARFQSFAEVVGSEELTAPLNETGKSPGRPLSEYIDLSDGSYLYEMPVTSTDQQRLRSLSELTGDRQFRDIATAGTVPISLEHLRDHDSDKTLVRVGYMIDYTHEESTALGLNEPDSRA